MTPLQYLLDKVFIDQLFAEEKREDFKCEKLTEQGIIEMRDPVELIAGTEIEPGFSLAAKLHFAASMKNHPLASEFTELSLLKESILKPKIEICDGCVKVPQGPGFGFELDADVFEKYKIDL